jgi:hypothetical protein
MTSEYPARLEAWKDIAAFVALLDKPEAQLEGTCVRTIGAEKWEAHVDIGGTVYRVDVARYARRECPWSWEISSEGVHVRGGDERTLEEVETWLSEALADVLVVGNRGLKRGTAVVTQPYL